MAHLAVAVCEAVNDPQAVRPNPTVAFDDVLEVHGLAVALHDVLIHRNPLT